MISCALIAALQAFAEGALAALALVARFPQQHQVPRLLRHQQHLLLRQVQHKATQVAHQLVHHSLLLTATALVLAVTRAAPLLSMGTSRQVLQATTFPS